MTKTPLDTTTDGLRALWLKPTMWSNAEEQYVAANTLSSTLKLSEQSLVSWLANASRMP